MERAENKSQTDWFSADRPIVSRTEDRLGRDVFATALADAVRGWKGRDSLVVALYGAWGTGKSSIKNMVIDALRENTGAAGVIDFNPWQVANRNQLSEAFFDEIGIALDKGAVGTRKDKKRVLDRWRRYAARLRSGGKLLQLFEKPIRWTLIISAVLVLGSTPFNQSTRLIIAVAFALVAALFTWASDVVEQIVNNLGVGVEVGKKSLEEIKQEMSIDLRKLSAPVLVVVDDLDRLTPSELVEMFQLVKANADFPNLVYLLLCERAVVEKHIEEVWTGPHF